MASTYSFTSRLNNICFFGLIVLGLMSAGNFITGYYTPKKVEAKFQLKDIVHLYNLALTLSIRDAYHDAQDALIKFDFDADLTKLFDWNTHLVFAWISVEFSHNTSV